MQVYHNVRDIRAHLTDIKHRGQTIGLVPTMGALHAGHITLVNQARECDVVVVSVFVNPLQFNQKEDLEKYPRDIHGDLAALANHCDIVFAPTVQEMYPTENVIKVDFGALGNRLEGKFRPGHFNGVGVVVSKLFNILQPDKAYFGLKDLQQYLLIKQMVHDFSFPIDIVGCPIVRESSGLAMSSRNQRLSEAGLQTAAHIYEGLQLAKQYFSQKVSIHETKSAVMGYYNGVNGLSVEYLEIVDEHLVVVDRIDQHHRLSICVAAFVEGVRLIDNLYLRTE